MSSAPPPYGKSNFVKIFLKYLEIFLLQVSQVTCTISKHHR